MAGEDEDYGSARITIDLDDTGVVADAQQLGQRIQAALNRATNGIARQIRRNLQDSLRAVSVQIRVEPDLTRFDASLLRQLRHLDSIDIPVSPDLSRFDARLLAGLNGIDSLNIPVAPDVSVFMARLRAALADEEVSIRVVPDLDDFDSRIRAHNAPNVRVNADVDTNRFTRSLAGLSRIAGGIGRTLAAGLRFGAIGIAVAGAAQGVATLVGALAPAVGIVAAAPAAFLGLQAVMGTLKLALDGVGKAFSTALTGNAKQFETALKGLSPAAQAAAKEVRALKPAFDALKASVQGAFFKPLKGDIEAAANALGGPLKTGMTAVSAEFGRLASSALEFAKSSASVKLVQGVFAGLKTEIAGIRSDSIERLLTAVANFTRSTLPGFTGLGSAIDGVANKLAAFLERATKAGSGLTWIQNALTVFQQLGGIAQNVGSILSSVFSAAGNVGAGFLANIQTITGQVAAFLKTASGQSAVGNIFATIGTIAQQLGPILSALVTQIGQIAPALGPVFATLGPAITGLINALGPALAAIAPSLQTVAAALSDAFESIGPSLGPLGQAIAQVITALAPLLPLAGQLVSILATALAPVLSTLAQAFQPIIQAVVGALMPILPPLADAFVQLVTALTPLATGIGQAIAQVFQILGPVLTQVADVIAQVVVALVPLITALTNALLPILPPLVEAFAAILQAIVPILPPVAQLVAALAPLLVTITNLLAPVLQIAAAFVSWTAINIVVPIIQAVVGILTGLLTALTSVVTFITNLPSLIVAGLSALGSLISTAFTAVVTFFQGLPGMILTALQALPGLLSNLFHLALQAVGTAIGVEIGLVILLFTRVPGLIVNALASLGSLLVRLFTSAWNAGKSAVSTGISAVVSFFSQLPGRAVSVLASLPGRAASVLRSAGSAMLGAARSAGSQLTSFFSGLPGKIKGALSGAASALVSVGRNLIQGMINGVKAMAGSIASAAKEVVGSAIKSAKSVLKINSPSKVFIAIGKGVGEGFIIGMTGSVDQIKATAQKLSQSIIAAFKGKNTKLDDSLLKLVSDGNKKLTSLANQRDAIAKQIADAQKFATDTAASALQSFSLQNLTQGGVSLFNITEGLDQAVSQVKDFTKQINDLSKRGLRKDLLSQIIALGPQQGAQLAEFLSNQSTASLKEINDLQKQLVSATNSLGKSAADDLFDAGKQASKGFLAGLKGQQKDIEDLMVSIAKAMQKSIRAALGIHSPSTVFRKIGDLTGLGLHDGFLGRLADLAKAARSSARRLTDAVSQPLSSLASTVSGPVVQPSLGDLSGAGLVLPGSGQPSGSAFSAARTAIGASVTNNITVQAANDPEQTARVILRRIAVANLT
ncbi:phage tail protein [Streptomyces prunicolor]|uniref:phage tail protein n=1 Tax=Streptomyces prunicolor TaxID=67348 RepID=UPI0003694FCF|nr:hypothetical protein [Streptomyces prunicolor]